MIIPSVHQLLPSRVSIAPLSGNPLFHSTREKQQIPVSTDIFIKQTQSVAHHSQFGAPQFGASNRGVFSEAFKEARRWDRDLDEFMDIVDGHINDQYIQDQITHQRFLLPDPSGDGGIIIDKPTINIPVIHHGNQPPDQGSGKGVGSGDGEVGNPIDKKTKDGNGTGEASNEKGPDAPLEPWQHRVTATDLAKLIMAGKYGLPFLIPQEGDVSKIQPVRESVKTVPPGPLDRKRTFKNAIKRHAGKAIGKGEEPDFNTVYVTRPDQVYKAIENEPVPFVKIAIHFVSDVSGSITKDMREMARRLNWLTSFPIKYQYGKMAADLAGEEYDNADHFGKGGANDDNGLAMNYYVYTTEAKKVSEKDYYETTQSGGTEISSGLNAVIENIQKNYSPSAGWNNYVYHFSDMDNDVTDNPRALESVETLLQMGIRLFGNCYIIDDDAGYRSNRTPEFIAELQKKYKENPHVGSVTMHSSKNKVLTWQDYETLVKAFLPGEIDEAAAA